MGDSYMRGVIDRFEGDYAVVVLDDDQQMNWPRSGLLPQADPGTAVRLRLRFARSRPPDNSNNADAAGVGGHIGASGAAPLRKQALLRTAASVAANLMYDALAPLAEQWVLKLPDGGSLRWAASGASTDTVSLAPGPVSLELIPDAADTAARRQRVAGLLDEILGASG